MKATICAVFGLVGAWMIAALGGFDMTLQALMIFMAVDYITGIVVAAVFHKSGKSGSGALESRAGFKGLCRKATILLLVLVAHYLDMVIGVSFVRDAVCLAFLANEGLSILENVGLMGVTYPDVLRKALDVLQKRSEIDGEIEDNNVE